MGTNKKIAAARAVPISLGDIVRDPVTGIQGVAVAITKWLHGCKRFTVQPIGKKKDGAPHDSHTFDEPQLDVVKRQFLAGSSDTGGPRPEPRRRPEAPR